MTTGFKSGFAAIIGKPNVGKSTLLNSMLGEKIAIMSDKPQTTRNKILAIMTDNESQCVFIDTPGIHSPHNRLGEYMVNVAENSLNEVDAILFVIQADEALGSVEEMIIEKLKATTTPVILIINKIDLIKKDKILSLIQKYSEMYKFHTIIPISAINKDGTNAVLEEVKKLLPEGPKFYPEDQITDQPEKQIVAEIIREKILQLVDKEVPHGIAVEVMSMKSKKDKDLVEILANIYCEKDSHKGIIIGKNGAMLKKIGSQAREETEGLLGSKVFMQLWVKVKKDWRNNNYHIKNFGYE